MLRIADKEVTCGMKEAQLRFEEAKRKVIGIERQRFGIGTYGEKTVHSVLKNYYEMDKSKQEIPIANYVADIYRKKDGVEEIVEIQSSQFKRMKNKLTAFLPSYQVTIVYPVELTKWLIWMDEETGTVVNRRKSSKKGSPYLIFQELYQIKEFLRDPHLRIRLSLIDVEEYRILDGYGKSKKKRATKFDRIPIQLQQEIALESLEDYDQFIPYQPDVIFTVKDFAKLTKIPVSLASLTLHTLFDLDRVKRVGKKGNAYLYKKKQCIP
jgi:hypothetical protein